MGKGMKIGDWTNIYVCKRVYQQLELIKKLEKKATINEVLAEMLCLKLKEKNGKCN